MNLKTKIFNGDCLKEANKIDSSSVDLIITDLPYGIMKGIDKNNDVYKKGVYDWDEALNVDEVFKTASRILKKNAKMLLFSQQPFTTKLLQKKYMGIKHLYQMYWEKEHFGNPLSAKIAPLSYIEEICVFKKLHDKNDGNPLRDYSEKVQKFINKKTKEINIILGHSGAQHFFNYNGMQFSLCTEKTYNELINTFGINKMNGFITYAELLGLQNKYGRSYSVFNLWDGKGHKSNLLKYAKDKDKYHPTQKPVKLLEDLIKTFSNEGDVICDLTMGSGSTGVAAINSGRKFIGIEKDSNFFKIATTRIDSAILSIKNTNRICQ